MADTMIPSLCCLLAMTFGLGRAWVPAADQLSSYWVPAAARALHKSNPPKFLGAPLSTAQATKLTVPTYLALRPGTPTRPILPFS